MKKTLLLLFLIFAPMRGYASVIANPWMLADPVRTLVGIIISLLKSAETPKVEALMVVTQEEVDALVDGSESYQVDEGTGSAASPVPSEAYDYVNTAVLSNTQKTPYEPLNAKITSGGDMEKVVKEMFFFEATDANPLTDEKRQEIEAVRTDYLTTLAKSYLRTAYEVQEKIIENLDSISADVNADGSIGSVSGIDQTWKTVNKTLIADIGLQIQMMELDAARFLTAQPVRLMSETRPETSN